MFTFYNPTSDLDVIIVFVNFSNKIILFFCSKGLFYSRLRQLKPVFPKLITRASHIV